MSEDTVCSPNEVTNVEELDIHFNTVLKIASGLLNVSLFHPGFNTLKSKTAELYRINELQNVIEFAAGSSYIPTAIDIPHDNVLIDATEHIAAIGDAFIELVMNIQGLDDTQSALEFLFTSFDGEPGTSLVEMLDLGGVIIGGIGIILAGVGTAITGGVGAAPGTALAGWSTGLIITGIITNASSLFVDYQNKNIDGGDFVEGVLVSVFVNLIPIPGGKIGLIKDIIARNKGWVEMVAGLTADEIAGAWSGPYSSTFEALVNDIHAETGQDKSVIRKALQDALAAQAIMKEDVTIQYEFDISSDIKRTVPTDFVNNQDKLMGNARLEADFMSWLTARHQDYEESGSKKDFLLFLEMDDVFIPQEYLQLIVKLWKVESGEGLDFVPRGDFERGILREFSPGLYFDSNREYKNSEFDELIANLINEKQLPSEHFKINPPPQPEEVNGYNTPPNEWIDVSPPPPPEPIQPTTHIELPPIMPNLGNLFPEPAPAPVNGPPTPRYPLEDLLDPQN